MNPTKQQFTLHNTIIPFLHLVHEWDFSYSSHNKSLSPIKYFVKNFVKIFPDDNITAECQSKRRHFYNPITYCALVSSGYEFIFFNDIIRMATLVRMLLIESICSQPIMLLLCF